MAYCPTCGFEVHEGQRFCPECGTKLSAAAASADASNAVPHRPVGVGQGVQWNSPTPPHLASDEVGGERDPDELDDFFSSYRRKGPEPAPDAGEQSAEAPLRRSRRRFNPDLSYEDGPLPAAPRPAHPTGGTPVTPPAAAPEWVGADDDEPTPVRSAAEGHGPPDRVEREPDPVAAPSASEAPMPSWFEELPDDAGAARSAHAAPDPFAAASERGSWDNFSSVTGELHPDDAPRGADRAHSERTHGAPAQGQGPGGQRPTSQSPQAPRWAAPSPADDAGAGQAPQWSNRPQSDQSQWAPSASDGASTAQRDAPTHAAPNGQGTGSVWQDDDLPPTQMHPVASTWQDDDIPPTQMHPVAQDDGPVPESWFGDGDEEPAAAAAGQRTESPRPQDPRAQHPGRAAHPDQGRSPGRGAVGAAGAGAAGVAGAGASNAAGASGANAPHSFDELLVGGGPRGPVVDDEQPISSRDFDQTGIVQMPNHPQARPSGAPSIFDAPGVAGRSPSGAPDPSAAPDPSGSHDSSAAASAAGARESVGPVPPNRPSPDERSGAPAAFTPPPTFAPADAEPEAGFIDSPPFANAPTPQPTYGQSPSAAPSAPEWAAPDASFARPGEAPVDERSSASHGGPTHAAPDHGAPQHAAPEYGAHDAGSDPFAPPPGGDGRHASGHGAPSHGVPEQAAPEHAAWEPEPPAAGYGVAAHHDEPSHRQPEHRAPEHVAGSAGPSVDEDEAQQLESWFGAETSTTRFDAAPSIDEANRGARRGEAPQAAQAQGRPANDAAGADLLGAWFGGEDEQDDPRAAPKDDGAARGDAARPWYDQGIDDADGPSDRVAHAGAAPAAAPEWAAPQGGGYVEPGAEHVAHGSRAGGRTAGSGGSGPGGRGGPGDRGPRSGGPGGPGGSGGGRLDRTGRRRLLTIAIAVVGSILLIVSAVIIGGQMRDRQADVAESPDQGEQTAPEDQQSAPEETEAAPPAQPPAAVADPNFQFTSFQSESANLRCVVSPQFGVACQHSNPAFAVPDTVCSDSGATGAVVGLDSNGYTFPCLTEDIPYGQPTLAMDTPTQVGEFTCTITLATGVTCTNAAGDSVALEFEQGITTAGRASTTPQQPVSPLPQ